MPQKINERPFTGKCSWGIKGSSSCGQMNNVWLPIPTVLVHNIFRAHWENLTKSGANIHLDSKKVTLTSHRFVVSSVVVKMISQVTLKEILCLQVWHERLLGLKNVSRSHKAIDRIENYKNVKGGGGRGGDILYSKGQRFAHLHVKGLKNNQKTSGPHSTLYFRSLHNVSPFKRKHDFLAGTYDWKTAITDANKSGSYREPETATDGSTVRDLFHYLDLTPH